MKADRTPFQIPTIIGPMTSILFLKTIFLYYFYMLQNIETDLSEWTFQIKVHQSKNFKYSSKSY